MVKFIPYFRKQYSTNMNKEEILLMIQNKLNSKDWNLLNLPNYFVSNRYIEGEVNIDRFKIVIGKYGMTYGKISLLPVLKGIISENANGGAIVNITISVFKIGLITLIFPFTLLSLCLLNGFINHHTDQVVFSLLFLIFIYSSVLFKFNKELKNYVEFIEMILKDR